ncbi:hypothetical protein ABZ801_33460 [Actinomadura sp. NPDC047616]|uniref:hypothetical protein n=1 Tax=Actinomadura sp. NPDC047616 TaxID=3155914 RepID=UPI00340EAC57
MRFAGFDGPLEITAAASPRQALTALHGYLTACVDTDLLPYTTETLDRPLGADDWSTNLATMTDQCPGGNRTSSAYVAMASGAHSGVALCRYAG